MMEVAMYVFQDIWHFVGALVWFLVISAVVLLVIEKLGAGIGWLYSGRMMMKDLQDVRERAMKEALGPAPANGVSSGAPKIYPFPSANSPKEDA